MAGSSLFVLLDDIAVLLDDIAAMSKVAVKKTAGVLGDDLALNAEQVSGVSAERELPVIWAVAKGSMLNKCILVPAALLISAIFPWLITPLLMLGGAYLCFEGFEKVFHKYLPHDDHSAEERLNAVIDKEVDLVEFEKNKIKGAIRTDFILSAEIIVIALGVVQGYNFATRAGVVAFIAFMMTICVYGLVAGIVKLDDAGIHLMKPGKGRFKNAIGSFLLALAPKLMKTLAIVGTAAMFLVGGGIIVHGFHFLDVQMHHLQESLSGLSYLGQTLHFLTPSLFSGLVGIIVGGLTVMAYLFSKKVFYTLKPA